MKYLKDKVVRRILLTNLILPTIAGIILIEAIWLDRSRIFATVVAVLVLIRLYMTGVIDDTNEEQQKK